MGETRSAGGQRVRHSSPAFASAGIAAGAALLAVMVSAAPARCAIGDSFPATGSSASTQPGSKTVDLDLANADLHDVVDMLRRQTGANIVIQDGDKAFGKVNVHVSGVTLDRALKTIALSATANVVLDGDTYIVRPGGADLALTAASSFPPTQNSGSAQPLYRDADYHWYTIMLQHGVPRDVLYMLHWDQNLRPELARASGGPPPVEHSSSPIILMSGESVPSIPAGTGNIGASAANRSIDEANSDSQAHQFPGFGGIPGGVPGGPGFGGGGFPGAVGPGGAGQNTGGFPDGVDRMYALQGNNSLLIRATPEAYRKIKEIIKAVDIAPRQVQIKVEFVRADVADTDSFGISYQLVPFPGVNVQSNLAAGNPGSYGLSFAYGNLVGQMEAELTHNRSKVIAAPIITTTNNVQATIQVTTVIPYSTTTTIVQQGGGGVTNTQQQFLTIPTTLTVNPRINNDDTITLSLNPNITSIGPLPANGGLPRTETQSVQTTRTVRNNETMVLGGMINDNETSTRTGIPYLMNLPIIGSLFRNRIKTVNNTELLIFITPTIIGDNVDAPPAGGYTGGSVTP